MDVEKINDPRSEIDAIDGELLRLLNRRAEIALQVGAVKARADASLCDPRREHEVLLKLAAANPGPFDDHSIANIFQRIIDESLQLQQKTYREPATVERNEKSENPILGAGSHVAFLGNRGTFSEEAALGILGDDCSTVSCATFDDLFTAIDRKAADHILAPLENSLIGSVHRCVDLLLESSLSIAAEIILPISHYLIAGQAASFESIRTVESHPAALAQCERFFLAHPYLERIAADDTAGGVRRAIESGDETRAGIGGKRTAEIYGGKILREHLEDNPANFTRFVLLTSAKTDKDPGSKVTLVVRLRNRPGSLHGALRPFVRRNIDLLKIESLPIRDTPEEFNFYLDLQAPTVDAEMISAIQEIREQAVDVRHLGRYSTINLETKY